jgi:hypothetical protein
LRAARRAEDRFRPTLRLADVAVKVTVIGDLYLPKIWKAEEFMAMSSGWRSPDRRVDTFFPLWQSNVFVFNPET